MSQRSMLPVAGTGEGEDAVDEGKEEEGAVAMLKEERAARSAWKRFFTKRFA